MINSEIRTENPPEILFERVFTRAGKTRNEADELCRALLEISADGILIADAVSGRFKYANPAICAMLLYNKKELLERGMIDIHPQEGLVRIVSLLHAQPIGEKAVVKTVPCRKKGGSLFYADVNAAKTVLGGTECIVGYFRDTSERKCLEEEKGKFQLQLHQSQKMIALGQLTGGMAHDFNNILGAIIGFCDVLQIKMKQVPELMKYVDKIKSASLNASHFIKQLLTFARKVTVEIKPIDMHNEIEQTIEMLKHTIDKRIIVQSRLKADNCIIEGDKNLIRSMLLNIGVNARDAMPEGGMLVFTTETISLNTKSFLNNGRTITPGKYLKISITDTGIGMDKKMLAHIFEPFFTTKEVGKGTGLDLSIVYSTVNKHHGLITVESTRGKGTEFIMYLPLKKEIYSTGCKAS